MGCTNEKWSEPAMIVPNYNSSNSNTRIQHTVSKCVVVFACCFWSICWNHLMVIPSSLMFTLWTLQFCSAHGLLKSIILIKHFIINQLTVGGLHQYICVYALRMKFIRHQDEFSFNTNILCGVKMYICQCPTGIVLISFMSCPHVIVLTLFCSAKVYYQAPLLWN